LAASDETRRVGDVHFSVHSGTDIQTSTKPTGALSLNEKDTGYFKVVIAEGTAPSVLGSFANISAEAAPEWCTIFVRQWTSTRASHSGSRQNSSERWTCWRSPAVGHADKFSAKQLSSIFLPVSGLQNLLKRHEVGGQVFGELVSAC
jgi:hypothetical protein